MSMFSAFLAVLVGDGFAFQKFFQDFNNRFFFFFLKMHMAEVHSCYWNITNGFFFLLQASSLPLEKKTALLSKILFGKLCPSPIWRKMYMAKPLFLSQYIFKISAPNLRKVFGMCFENDCTLTYMTCTSFGIINSA